MAKTKKADKANKDRDARADALAWMGAVPDEQNTKKKVERDRAGRPTVMTVQTLQKLEQAFKIGATRGEACTYAGISRQTLLNFIEKYPDFLAQIEEWEDHPVLAARANIIGAVTQLKSIPDSWSYLRAKRKGEFAEQKNHKVDVGVVSIDDLEQAAAEGVIVDEATEE